MNPATSDRRDREAAFRLDLLLDAAESVFLEKGFAAAPVEEIARRAGVALATLYKSFPSKEEAFVRVINRRVDRFHAWIRERSATGTPIERLEAVVRGTLEYFDQHEEAFRLYLVPHGVPWNIRSGLGDEIFRKYLGDYVTYIEELCRAAGTPAKRSTARLRALAVSGTLNNVLVDAFSRSGRPDLRAQGNNVWATIKPVVCGK